MMSEDECRTLFFERIKGLLLPAGELLDIQDVYWFVERAHRGKFRDGGEPYITHPAAVALILVDRGYHHKNILIKALCHDVVEDTDAPANLIIKVCGYENWVSLNVLSKNEPIFEAHTGRLLGRREKSNTEYRGEMAIAFHEDRLVKLADRKHNMSTMDCWDKARRVAYAEDTREWILPIADATHSWFAKQLREAIQKELG